MSLHRFQAKETGLFRSSRDQVEYLPSRRLRQQIPNEFPYQGCWSIIDCDSQNWMGVDREMSSRLSMRAFGQVGYKLLNGHGNRDLLKGVVPPRGDPPEVKGWHNVKVTLQKFTKGPRDADGHVGTTPRYLQMRVHLKVPCK